jgi:hypothetical protein
MWDKLPRDKMRRRMKRGYADAKQSMDDVVDEELRALRRAIRRRRKQLGL